MARYIVLSFDDNTLADRFLEENRPQVVGVFAKPTMFCSASGAGGHDRGRRVRSWVRGKKFGWWVCGVCHKPSSKPGPEKQMRAVVSQGVNLLAQVQDLMTVFYKEELSAPEPQQEGRQEGRQAEGHDDRLREPGAGSEGAEAGSSASD